MYRPPSLAVSLAACLAATVSSAPPAALEAQQTHVLIVAGIGGSAEYRERFHGWASDLRAALVERHGLAPERVTYLGEEPDRSPGVMAGKSTRANILKTLGELATRVGPRDRILVVLIGHGTSQRGDARFNLPGPDLSAEDFAAGLAAFPTQALALVHTGSAGGGFVQALSGPNRVIVSATRTARERNATAFPRFFVDAVAGHGADLDKNGSLSLLEAYVYATQEVERYYKKENQILTEHSVLDDNGDGQGSHNASLDGPDGRLAALFALGSVRGGVAATGATPTTADPELARLYRERADIQKRIDDLRAARDTLPRERYEADLERLLVELALKIREIRTREGGL